MRLYLDTEFNGFGGQLMSMALVPHDKSRPEFYKELTVTGQIHPWVREHVVPHMTLAPSTHHEFQMALAEYLWSFKEDVTIVADWPDDIKYFCESLVTGPGMMLSFVNNMKFELDFGIQYESEVPHNALHDARGIREYFIKREQKETP